MTALHSAWKRAQPGDRLILIVDEVEGALAAVQMLTESCMENACAGLISMAVGA